MVKEDIKKDTPKEEEPMKIYDKYMYKSQEKMKSIILIIAVFIIGFAAGYLCQYSTVNKLNNEIEDLKANNINSLKRDSFDFQDDEQVDNEA